MVEDTKSRAKGEPAEKVAADAPAMPPVVVKKYANRRLYNTESSSYVTLEDLAGMVRRGRDFVVYDAKSGEDITRSVLTQIIVEEEAKGRNLLPTPFLRQLIGLYGDSLQSLVPRYLEFAMGGFAQQQEQMRRAMTTPMAGAMTSPMGGLNPFSGPFGNLEELGKQNMAMLERAMSLFSPFPVSRRENEPAEAAEGEVAALRQEIAALKAELNAVRAARKD
ncbi:polyhydroxyalkanoate synthesis repressor PhaR [Roseomonas cutis]|uniref:polyhydroxyalkanoate synthesis repressor PhaR n=1 Tax=Roseomonas cutis TaxID=2897332 RepID=UPI00351D8A90